MVAIKAEAVSHLLAEDKRGNARRDSGKKIKRDEEGFQTVSRETKRDVPLYHSLWRCLQTD